LTRSPSPRPTDSCPLCGSDLKIERFKGDEWRLVVDCTRCGKFSVEDFLLDEYRPRIDENDKTKALLSYTVRKLQKSSPATLTREFLEQTLKQSLPSPAEATDNLLLELVEQNDGRPGQYFDIREEPRLLSVVGAVGFDDIRWLVDNLKRLRLVDILSSGMQPFREVGSITGLGWERAEEIRRAHVSSKYAFFARRFANSDLDKIYEECLRPAVRDTGYELRIVSQQAGLIDAIMEDEIRRCRFLIADLTNESAGAYWEAGLAEGLGKPVIYICAEQPDGSTRKTHFDTNHRHTIPWSLTKIEETAKRLKAVIRNTLLGDATQEDSASAIVRETSPKTCFWSRAKLTHQPLARSRRRRPSWPSGHHGHLAIMASASRRGADRS
jgi:nucleoside 2-deoxyribosyltransferase